MAAKSTAKKAPAKTAAAKAPKTPFGKKFLDEQKKALLAERARYVQSADTLQAEADSLLEARDPVEAIRLKAKRLKVMRRGKVIAETPSDQINLNLKRRPKTLDLRFV